MLQAASSRRGRLLSWAQKREGESGKQIPRRYACASLLGMTTNRATRHAPRARAPRPSALSPIHSHRTGSPTVIDASVRTWANAPPRQCGRNAACRPGNASSIRSQGVNSPPMSKRASPMRSTRFRVCSRSTPLTSKFARRFDGSMSASSSAMQAAQASCVRIVICRRRLRSTLPATPCPALSSACSTGSIGPRCARLIQMARSSPGMDGSLMRKGLGLGTRG